MGKSRKFEGVGRGGDAMTHTLWNGNSREVGGLRQKCSPLGGGEWIFSKITQFQQYPRESKPLGTACVQALYFKWRATIRERTRPPITLLLRAARVCLSRYFPQRVCSQAMTGYGMDQWICSATRAFQYLVSRSQSYVLQTHVMLPDNLDTSTFKRPQTCKKRISLSLESKPTFQRKKNVAYILEAVFVVVVWNVR